MRQQLRQKCRLQPCIPPVAHQLTLPVCICSALCGQVFVQRNVGNQVGLTLLTHATRVTGIASAMCQLTAVTCPQQPVNPAVHMPCAFRRHTLT